MSEQFFFNHERLNRLFPFYLRVNKELELGSFGSSIEKMCGLKKNSSFNQCFKIVRPFVTDTSFQTIRQLVNQLVIIETCTGTKTTLRGQFEWFTETEEILFVGSPWINSIEDIQERALVIDDFANHDPLIDLLHVLKSREITNDDLKELIVTINTQKKELQKANKEAHDIALFPTQSPDPLIRINFSGEVLRNNPAAAKLDFFEYKNKVYRNDDFFALVAAIIDKSNPRWIIEAKSDGRDYSFVCVTMMDEGYVNVYGRDITQQKNDQQQLERLSLVASANKLGVLFTNPNGQITWANEGFCKLTGYSQEEIIGKTPVELCRGALTDEQSLTKILESFFRGEGFSTEIIYYRKDKSWFWGRSVSQPVLNKSGQIVEFFGFIEDVTDKKINEEKLRILSQIVEDNSNAVIITDKEGRITWVNKSFVTITGYSGEEVIGKKPGSFLQGPETNPLTVSYLSNQILKGESFNAEILNYSKSGETYWVRIDGQPIINEQGEITGFFALEADITKEKESESRFRKALENIGDNVWEHDFATGKTYFSKTNNEILGCSTNDLSNNQEIWWASVYEADKELLIDNDRKYRAGEITSHSLEYRIVHKDGTIRWVLDRGVVIEKGRNGKPMRITGTHTDITGQKNLETELIRSREHAEMLARAKETFLANMSHEMRTPMNAIIGMGNQLNKTSLNEKQQFYLNIINQAADNLLIIINDILDLSKIEAGKLNIEKIGFSPRNVITNAMQVVMHKAEEKGLQLINSYCDNEISKILIGDPYRLNQILLNLLSNAIKFTDKGKVDILLELIEDKADSQQICLTVTDSGIGMDPEFINRLFDKFSQESDSVSRRYGGTGLGMSICKELIELMNGTIKVFSKKGEGTSVVLSLELKKGTDGDLIIPVTEAVSADVLSGKCILVTDDNDMNRLIASTILKNYGATVIEATNGAEALETIANGVVDLVLMDIHMPVMNGFEAAQQIRKNKNPLPIIALTANVVKDENDKCIEAGMNAYIAKPFKEEEFIKTISYWLHNQNNQPMITKLTDSSTTDSLYSLAGLQDIARGDQDFIQKMILLFSEQSIQIVGQIKQSFNAGQFKEMGEAAHKLKPSIDNLKIHSLEKVTREIERAGKENEQVDNLAEQISFTEAKLIEVVAEMKKELI